MKRCSRCKEEKAITEFFKNPKSRAKDGLQNVCKKCNSVKTQEWRKKNPEKVRAYNRVSDRKRRFGLTAEMYQRMLLEQNGKCAICENPSDKSLAVDHNHLTSEIRGLLCSNCNVGIGFFQDDPILLKKAADYLMRSVRIPA